jgi:hypothetical protein
MGEGKHNKSEGGLDSHHPKRTGLSSKKWKAPVFIFQIAKQILYSF